VFPDDFGNPWMANLTEIGLPEPVPWWPLAPGWYAVAALVLSAAAWLAWRALRRHRDNAYRRVALAELQQLEREPLADAAGLRQLPELLKRTALAAYPRSDVAALGEEAWLGFLDGALGTTEFTTGAGRLLPQLAYAPSAAMSVTDTEARSLLALARRWIRHHRRTNPVRDRG